MFFHFKIVVNMYITRFLEILCGMYFSISVFLFVVEEVPLLWSHFVLQAASP